MAEQIIINGLLTSYFFYPGENPKKIPSVIFLHGWGSSKEVWIPTVQNLQERGLASYCLDLPGFGKTELPPKAWRVEDYAEFVVDFFKKNNLSSTIVVGHSFGGRVAIVLAATHPELVTRLVLVDSAGVRTHPKAKKVLALIARFVRPFFRLRWTNPLRRKIYRLIGAEDYVATPALNQTFVNVIGEDLMHYLPQILQPTLIIWGRNDFTTPISYANQFLNNLKNARPIVLERAGHYSFLDAPDEFSQALETFINS